MIRAAFRPSPGFAVACSGGPDSMAALDFFARKNPQVSAAFFHHGDKASDDAAVVVSEYCRRMGLEMLKGAMGSPIPKGASAEAHWRKERMAYLRSLGRDIVTGHTLDDAAEWWIISSMRYGNPSLTPERSGSIIRPLMRNTRRSDTLAWCRRWKLEFHDDPENHDESHLRVSVRRHVLPAVLLIQPGLHSMISRMISEGASCGE